MKIELLRIPEQFALIALLAGCATTPPAPVRVDVPVMVSCVGAVPVPPAFEFDKLPLARDWPRGRKYEGALEAVIAGCI